ncbi:heterokaryon incompatibility protein-domain-containing protein [Paraphoma chrysanthemicola]|uniref:Heterokaryon incompatibility protein-domain-containing protein n=1 Tax=Paraphoma chrysanthemicola TaxID=798071 RepID=A0A8K0RI75_9PLEO|nr:heterokaryon incompatibility protein-domain-containing protein [Paraphoma chrysanthemicola]
MHEKALSDGSHTTGHTWPDYSYSDFCDSCSRLDLHSFKDNPSFSGVVKITLSPRCPMCRFFNATLHGCKSSSYVEDNTEIHLKPSSGAVVLASYTRDVGMDRYIIQLADGVEPIRRGERINIEVPRSDSVNMELISEWVSNCQAKHAERCSDAGPEVLPALVSASNLKVIDCLNRSVVVPSIPFEYVALSYVWGQYHGQALADASDSMVPRRLPRVLPETIEDALKVCLQLGFRYLWVDQYCIDQSSDERTILKQLSSMDMIYRAASLTIIAAAGDNSNHGLPGVGSRNRIQYPSITVQGTTWISGSRYFRELMVKSKWYTRAWTYQEDFFSQRRLVFTDEQVFFECNTFACCESEPRTMGTDIISSDDVLGGPPRGDLESSLRSSLNFVEHVALYTRRKLTHQSDVLRAMNGFFCSFSRCVEPVQHYYGIPVDWQGFSRVVDLRGRTALEMCHATFSCSLAWESQKNTTSRARRDGFPSWSWAGWVTPVEWNIGCIFGNHVQNSFHALRRDGNMEPLTQELCLRATLDQENTSALYTNVLCIEAEVLQIRFVACKRNAFKNVHFGDRPDSRDGSANSTATDGTSKYFVVDNGTAQEASVVWELELTPDVNDAIHHSLCERVFDCIVLHDQYGLVVWEHNGVNERLGRLLLEGHVRLDRYIKRHISDHFPGYRRTIYLS